MMILNRITSKIKNHHLSKKYTRLIYPPQADIHTLARLLYPNGAWVKFDNGNINKMYQQTNQLSWQNETIYGGVALLLSDLYASADVLYRDDRYKWNIVEAYNEDAPITDIINDMAFKKFVFEQVHFPIRKCIALKVRGFQVDTIINVKNLFDTIDVTKEVLNTYKYFTAVSNQDLEPICNAKTLLKTDSVAYIDYSKHETAQSEPNLLFYVSRPLQSYCRISLKGRTHHLKQYLWHSSDNFYRSQIDFLVSNTEQADNVYVRNYEFEQAHHRQMAKMFPDKTKELTVLNEKLCKWTGFSPLPDFNEPKIADDLAEFRAAYKQRYKRWWQY